MPTIRVTDATWARMKLHARPLEDTPDDIVWRALDALEGRVSEPKKSAAVGRPKKGASGKKLPQREIREPLLLTLDSLGGDGSLDQIRDALLPRLADRLTEADYALVTTGEARWWNAACWERYELVKAGLLSADAPRGRWMLSPEGRAEVRSLRAAKKK